MVKRQKPKEGEAAASGRDQQQGDGPKEVPITKFPARWAKGALSAANWSASRIGMRDKAQRVGENKRKATKHFTKPVAPGTKR